MDPDRIPVIVQRIWAAHKFHFSSPRWRKTRLTMLVLCGHLAEADGHPEWEGLPSSPSTVERARREYPEYLPWPMHRYMRPPWEDQPVQLWPEDCADPSGEILYLQRLDDAGNPSGTVPLLISPNGIVRAISRVPESLTAAAAMLSGGMLLDGLDGRLDSVLHWCRFVGAVAAGHPF